MWPGLRNVLFKILYFNHVAVMIFLVVSGFCLYYPLCLKSPSDPRMRVSYSEFMKKRAMRIFPPYLVAIGLSLVLTLFMPGMELLSRTPDGQHPLPVSWAGIISHLFLVHNLSPAWFAAINYPVWTIGLEWQLYLLFPLIVFLFRKSMPGVLAASFAVAFLIYVVTRKSSHIWTFALYNGPLYYIFVFSAGMCAARVIAERNFPLSMAANKFLRWILWFVCIAAVIVVYRGSGGSLGRNCSSAVGSACLLILAADSSSWLHRLLSHRYLSRLGAFSYSFYLIHAPVLTLVNAIFSSLHLKPDTSFMGFFIVGLPTLILTSYCFHLAFEKPFMSKNR